MAQNQLPTPQPHAAWTATQAYVLAVVCLALGVALGYLFRGSASRTAETSDASVPADNSMSQSAPASMQAAPGPDQQKAMVDQAVAPLLATLKATPDDFDTIVKVANMYYDGRQYPDAIKYYQMALKSQPQNADVLTDLGTSMWYTGDADGAITQYQLALKYHPDHVETLFNLGLVRWQGKTDPKGAIEAWEELLKRNPNYPQKQQVQEYIEKARQHAKS